MAPAYEVSFASADITDEADVGAVEGDDAPTRALSFALGNGVVFVLAAHPEAVFSEEGPADTVCFFAGGELVDLPNGLGLGWRHDEPGAAWFAPRPAQCLTYRHRLSLTDGITEREALVEDEQGRQTVWRETRLVSLAHANLVLLRWHLTPRNWEGHIVVRSQLDLRAHPLGAGPAWAHGGEPQTVRNLLPSDGLAAAVTGPGGRQQLRVDVAMRTSGSPGRQAGRGHDRDSSYQQHRIQLTAGTPVCIDVAMSVADASPGAPPAPGAGLVPGFEQELERQRATWQTVWSRVHVSAPRDVPLERACRFNAFHLLQAVSPLSVGRDVGLPAWAARRTLPGQEAWDETLALPFYSLHLPALARELLGHRARRLAAGEEAGRDMRPWRGAAALNVWHHHLATHDLALLGGASGEVLVDTARFWMTHGPAEGSLVAAWSLRCAARLRELLGGPAWDRLCERTGLEPREPGQWHEASRRVPVPWLDNDVIALPGQDGLATLLLMHVLGPTEASALLAHLGAEASPNWFARTVRHHLARNKAGGSLSRVVCAGVLATVDAAASWACFHKAVHAPLAERPDPDDGFSFGAMGATWDVLQRHYLGIQPQLDGLRLDPHPPDALDDIAVRVCLRGHWATVRLHDREITLQTEAGAPSLQVRFEDRSFAIPAASSWTARCR